MIVLQFFFKVLARLDAPLAHVKNLALLDCIPNHNQTAAKHLMMSNLVMMPTTFPLEFWLFLVAG